MCTAVSYNSNNHYFGRNLDLEYSYKESVTIMPRNYTLNFLKAGTIKKHYAMIGMAYVVNNYPLYYDATNEKGLSIAGLRFLGKTKYQNESKGKKTVAVFEMIPYILAQCKNVDEVEKMLCKINVVAIDYSEELKTTELHFIIADKKRSIVVEFVEGEMIIYENPIGVLTNEPEFLDQMTNFEKYMGEKLPLPGDVSSMSRFVRAAFVKMNSIDDGSENSSVQQFFHILTSVEKQRGCERLENGEYPITIYSSCVNTREGIYYYTDYNDRNIKKVDMNENTRKGSELLCFELKKQ